MITFYNKFEIDFTYNGLGILDNYIINPVVSEELNGIFSLEFDYPISAPYFAELSQEKIVKCDVPNMSPQLFRISEREANIGGTFHVVAFHIFYDLLHNLIEDTFIVNRDGESALQQLLNAVQFPHNFTGRSDINTINSARIVRKNVVETLLNSDNENSYLSRWSGEIVRDNFHVEMRRIRGSDNGVSIRDKKNLTGYRSNVDFGTVVTRIMPQGFDGLLLPEKYVDSPIISDYITPKIRVIKYDHIKAEDFLSISEAQNALRELAQKEYTEHHIDVPNAMYNIEFAPLENTLEYRDFAVLESIAIGDVVRVIHEEDGLDISARMVSCKFNPLTSEYITINLGNFSPRFTDISKSINRLETGVNQANDNANFALQSANGKNTNYYGSATPANPRKGDVWFKENGEKIEIWIYETREGVTQWFMLSGDIVLEEMRLELEDAARLVAEAKVKSEAALQAGADAAIAAGQAKIAGEEAKSAAADALSAGESAQTAATHASAEAQEAVAKANQAYDNAASALGNSNSAVTQATSANTAATNAFNKSVKSTAVTYAVSTSGTAAPTVWQTAVPTTAAGQFLWTRTVITLQDNSAVTSYSVAKHGETGAIGATVL